MHDGSDHHALLADTPWRAGDRKRGVDVTGRWMLDFPMEGRAEMARVAEYLKDEPIAAIYSSPRQRALESAGVLAEQLSTERGGVDGGLSGAAP